MNVPGKGAEDVNYAGDGLYREMILDHYKRPRNAGRLADPSFSHRELNPVCGDEVTFDVRVDGSVVGEARFVGRGCAISQASASMLAESLKGRPLTDVARLEREDILQLLAIPVGPVRIKCAMLGLVALKNGIAKYEHGRIHG